MEQLPEDTEREIYSLEVLDREVGGAGSVADAAGVGAVTDVHNALKTGVKLIEHAEVGADAEGENGCVNRDLSEVAPGDTVTIIGRDGGQVIRAEELAACCGTITNELLSRLGMRLPIVSG